MPRLRRHPQSGDRQDDGCEAGSDPDIQKLTADQMAAVVKNGKNKMKPVAGLTDQQIKDAVAYYRGLK